MLNDSQKKIPPEMNSESVSLAAETTSLKVRRTNKGSQEIASLKVPRKSLMPRRMSKAVSNASEGASRRKALLLQHQTLKKRSSVIVNHKN